MKETLRMQLLRLGVLTIFGLPFTASGGLIVLVRDPPWGVYVLLGSFLVVGVAITANSFWALVLRPRQVTSFHAGARTIAVTTRSPLLWWKRGTQRKLEFGDVERVLLLTAKHEMMDSMVDTTELRLVVKGKAPVVLANHAKRRVLCQEARTLAGLLGVKVISRRAKPPTEPRGLSAYRL